MDARVAVFASGEGTNLQALLDDPLTRPWISLVISDAADAGALRRAEAAGVETRIIDSGAGVPGGEGFEVAASEALREADIQVVVLAGFMRILGPALVEAFDGRMLNVHPSLLPSFPGAHAVADAMAHGVHVTGVTVHLVDELVDHGPIVVQEAVEIHDRDTWESLESRIHEAEHRCLPRALRALVEGRLAVDGRHVSIKEVV